MSATPAGSFENEVRKNRRRFLRFLAGSPLLAAGPVAGWQALPEAGIIADPKDAINVMDFEAAARKALSPAHFGYLATGVDDDATLRANREGFQHIQLRPRRMVDVTNADLRVEIFGTTWDTPIILAPVGSQKAFHPEGEVAAARAARVKRTLQILSTVTTGPIEEVIEANGKPIWYQLYPTSRWEITEKLVRKAEAAGCPVLVLTVDLPAGRNTETFERFKRMDSRKCTTCHVPGPQGGFGRKPMFDGIDMAGVTVYNPAMTWESVRKLKQMTKMKLVLKGIETREDALLCRENGVDGIIVSNHGGRAEESARGTIEWLPEVVDGAGGRIPVLVDGGFRRGTDIFKALALGARAICIGRPYQWGLAAFGQPGVERVLDILKKELELTMKQCGTTSIAQITRSSVSVDGRG
jgi:isopentenyl diphosphate isomerase/L-lactate dehydrogenase-like FMN-dependent dehydrogenase